MTTKKAGKIVEMLLENKTSLKEDLEKPENNWGNDVASSLVQVQITSLTNEIKWLKTLKQEIAPYCKHPKRLRDKTRDGTLYCMGCNLDL